MVSVRLLALACSAASAWAAREELDPWNFRNLELYIFAGSPPRCFQIFPGSRLAKGVPDIGTTPSECQQNWEEESDLGNFDGFKSGEHGQHYSGGSSRGCSTWLRMFVDGSLTQVEATAKLERTLETCDEYITIAGPESAFEVKKTSDGETQKPVADAAAAGGALAPSFRGIHDGTELPAMPEILGDAPGSPHSVNAAPFVLILVFGVAAAGCYVYRKSISRRNMVSDSAE